MELVFGIGFIICSLFSYFEFITHVSIALFMLYIIMIFWRKTEIYIKYLHSVFESVAVLLSMILIELCGYYVSERQMKGQFTGAIPLLLLGYWFFFEMLRLFDSVYEKRFGFDKNTFPALGSFISKDYSRTKKVLKCITIIAVVLLGYIFLCVMKTPSFELGLNRGQYNQMFRYSILYSKVLSWAQVILIPCVISLLYG